MLGRIATICRRVTVRPAPQQPARVLERDMRTAMFDSPRPAITTPRPIYKGGYRPYAAPRIEDYRDHVDRHLRQKIVERARVVRAARGEAG